MLTPLSIRLTKIVQRKILIRNVCRKHLAKGGNEKNILTILDLFFFALHNVKAAREISRD